MKPCQESMKSAWLAACTWLLGLAVMATAEVLYVDGRNGQDSHPGTQAQPLRTLVQAAQRINESNEPGPTTVRLAPGLYCLDQTVLFKNQRRVTQQDRLIIEASVLPDDPNWLPRLMPIVLSTQNPEPHGRENHMICLKVEVSHATIRGLRFLGNPTARACLYSVFREGKDLNDLVVTQCAFVGDLHTQGTFCPICANGQGVRVDHCVFFRTEIPVIFWEAASGISRGNAMTHCIVDGAPTAAVWTCQTADDLAFHHNIVTRCNYVWMRPKDNHTTYLINDCVVTDNRAFSGYGTALELFGATGPEVAFREQGVVKTGKVALDLGVLGPSQLTRDMPRGYLHPVPGTLGSDLGAGLFTQP
jgi:hypothetical protein